MCSNSITTHILDNYNINIYDYLLHHIDLNINFNKLNSVLQSKIINSFKDITIHEINTFINK